MPCPYGLFRETQFASVMGAQPKGSGYGHRQGIPVWSGGDALSW
jgi:hypothetical protein